MSDMVLAQIRLYVRSGDTREEKKATELFVFTLHDLSSGSLSAEGLTHGSSTAKPLRDPGPQPGVYQKRLNGQPLVVLTSYKQMTKNEKYEYKTQEETYEKPISSADELNIREHVAKTGFYENFSSIGGDGIMMELCDAMFDLLEFVAKQPSHKLALTLSGLRLRKSNFPDSPALLLGCTGSSLTCSDTIVDFVQKM